MDKFLKFLKYTFIALFTLAAIAIILAFNADRIEYAYDKFSYEFPLEIEGVSPGDTLSDIIFKLGLPIRECPDCEQETKEWVVGPEYSQDYIQITFDEGIAGSITTIRPEFAFGYDYPVETTEALIDFVGEPDILAISANNLFRRYTYVDAGVSFHYSQNNLESVTIGKVVWRGINEMGEYYIKGKLICPGTNCPWDVDGNLKAEFQDKDYSSL